ncbi:MAG: hypothetical protein HFJ54_01505 [Clostridia bacterium]|nr:hypothetical protein [Clostridia bacterium]
MNQKVGVFLSRMQPLHNGHLGIIDIVFKENQKVVILIGSKNKNGTVRNPLHVNLRTDILKETLRKRYGKEYEERIFIRELPDWSMETDFDSNLEWGRYLYYNIVSVCEQRQFSIYFSDEREIIENWFEDSLKKRINFRLFERKDMFEGISSTRIREAFLNNNKKYIEKSCPEAVINKYEEIKKILKEVNFDPKEDFSIS